MAISPPSLPPTQFLIPRLPSSGQASEPPDCQSRAFARPLSLSRPALQPPLIAEIRAPPVAAEFVKTFEGAAIGFSRAGHIPTVANLVPKGSGLSIEVNPDIPAFFVCASCEKSYFAVVPAVDRCFHDVLLSKPLFVYLFDYQYTPNHNNVNTKIKVFFAGHHFFHGAGRRTK